MRRFPNTRLRRNREQDFVRRLVREHQVSADDLIYPMFVINGPHQTAIPSMPDISRLSVDLAVSEAKMLFELGLPAIALFPNVDASLRTLMERRPTTSKVLYPQPLGPSRRADLWHHHRRRSRPLYEPRSRWHLERRQLRGQRHHG